MNIPSAGPSSNPRPGGGQGKLNQSPDIDYRHELVRKSIHLTSLSIPLIYYFIPRDQALSMLGPLTAAFLGVDIARHYVPGVARWFYSWFGWLLRQHEQDGRRKRLNGATYVLLSACICVAFFPKVVTVTAFAILIISDTTSALIGRKFGKTPFFNKSLEGSLGFFVSSVLVVLVSPKIQHLPAEYFVGVLGGAVGTLVESVSGRIDDNLTIPVSIGLVMWGLYAFLLPSVNVFQMG